MCTLLLLPLELKNIPLVGSGELEILHELGKIKAAVF